MIVFGLYCFLGYQAMLDVCLDLTENNAYNKYYFRYLWHGLDLGDLMERKEQQNSFNECRKCQRKEIPMSSQIE